jgi:DNA-binding beta-propeller fold protein YncE
VAAGRRFSFAPAAGRLRSGGRSVATPLGPTGLAALPEGPVGVVGGRERVLATYDPRTLRELARVPAGVGPTNVVARNGRFYVADTGGRALLIFETRPELALVHRGALPGAPWGLAVDPGRDRIWVTIPARNRVIGFSATRRPDRLQGFDTVRQPRAVAVRDGDVVVTGRDAVHVIDPDRD